MNNTLKQQLQEANFSEVTTEIILGHIKKWFEQKRPKKQTKNNVWTSTEYEQNAFITEILEELNNE